MLRPLIIFIAFILFFSDSWSQRKYLDSISRAQYVQRFPDYFFIWPVFRQRASSFVLQSASNSSNKVTFSPNIQYHAGVGFYLFEVGFQFIAAIPPSQASITEFGESNSLDLQANIIGNHWGVEANWENYKGYYVEDSSNPIVRGQPKEQRRDIETLNTSFTGTYFFNRRRFSIRATYNFYERQLKSAGSPFLLVNYTRFTVKADSLVYSSEKFPQLGDRGDFKDLQYTTVSFAPGYGYNFVIKHWFVGSSVNLGPSLQFFNYGLKDKSLDVQPYLNWRVTMGINSERFFAGVTYSYQTQEIDYENIRFTTRNGTFRLVFGYRFREVGVLKKRASEMIKPKSR